MKPLDGMLVLDFAQYLAGPSAALRLADMGARVIKVERPQGGDNGRRLVFKNLISDQDGVLFHTINRNKESFTADLKNPEDLAMVKKLISKADVMIENFRPGIMDRIGLGYKDVSEINPKIVYGTVTGYGTSGPWVKKPGQDLMVQSISGFTWLNGDDGQNPVPAALAMADAYTGIHLCQGILSCLFRRTKTGVGGLVEVSLLESILDLQFEMLATYLNNGHNQPVRGKIHNAHPYLGAPYGIYQTSDSYIALSIIPMPKLGELIQLDGVAEYDTALKCYENRDMLKEKVSAVMKENTTAHWVTLLESAGFWCSEVLNWEELYQHEGFQSLDMLIDIGRKGHKKIITTRCPIRFNGEKYKDSKCAPPLGAHTEQIKKDYSLNEGSDFHG